MEPGDQAFLRVERAQRVGAAGKGELQVQTRSHRDVPLQHRQREIVAGTQRQELLPLVARIGEHPGKIAAQGLDVRLHALAHPPLGPQELQGELGRTGTPALRPGDERLIENSLPVPERVPYISIGDAEGLGGMADRARLGHGRQ